MIDDFRFKIGALVIFTVFNYQTNVAEGRIVSFENAQLKAKLKEQLASQKGDNLEEDFKRVADTSNQLEKEIKQSTTRAEHAKSQAKILIDSPNISEEAKMVLKQKEASIYAAIQTNEHKPIKTAGEDLEKSIRFQKERMEMNIRDADEFNRLLNLPNAEILFQNTKPKPPKHVLDFKKITSKEKKNVLEKMQAELANIQNPASKEAVKKLLEQFSKDSTIPESWRKWAENPEAYGESDKEKDPVYVAQWLSRNTGEMRLATLKYDSFIGANQLTFSKIGVAPHNKEKIQKMGRKERNHYIGFLREQIGRYDKEEAKKMGALEVSEGAEAKAIKSQSDKIDNEKDKKLENNCDEIVDSINNSPLRKRLLDKIEAQKRQDEAEKVSEKNTSMAQKRELYAKSKKTGFLKQVWEKTKNSASSVLGIKRKGQIELREKEDTQAHNNAGDKVVEEMLDRGREGHKEKELISKEDRSELNKIFKFVVQPEGKEEWRILLQVMSAKEISREGVSREVKENPAFFHKKTKIGDSV